MPLVNVALGKKAFQSSLSAYSHDGEAKDAVSGVMPDRFAFHTAEQVDPWWYVDLGHDMPIHSIVLHNRVDVCQDRAYRCYVEVSSDLRRWVVVHTGFVFFGSERSGNPFVCHIASLLSARFVKIGIRGLSILHLAQVQVFSESRHLMCHMIREQYELPNLHLVGDYLPKKNYGVSYCVKGEESVLGGLPIRSIKLVRIGRLGNQVRQITNAIAFARRKKIKTIQIVNYGLINLGHPLDLGDVVLSPEGQTTELPCLEGDFFYEFLDLQPALRDFDGFDRYRIVHLLKKNEFFSRLTSVVDEKKPRELTVHMRAGDLFDRPNPNPGYVQPPLAFYTKVAKKLFDEGEIERIRIVYEDLGNPCVLALQEFAVKTGIEVRMTSGSLESDLAALIDAERLMFGVGTFGSAVCLLSERIQELYFFETIHNAGFGSTPSVARPIAVVDKGDKYIKTGYWHNTQEQREIMISYSEANLEIDPL